MNPQDPLANLHPLREPELIGWWPLAPGWWLLLFTTLLCVAALVYLLRKHYRNNAYRRRALLQLQSLHTQYQASRDTSGYLTELNALLKSVALQAFPPTEVASQYGEDWLLFLNRRAKPNEQFDPAFAAAVYVKSCPKIDVVQTHRAAKHWISHHKVAP